MPVSNFENSIDFSGQKFYVGLDVHKKSWAVTVRSLGRQVAHFTMLFRMFRRASGTNDRTPFANGIRSTEVQT